MMTFKTAKSDKKTFVKDNKIWVCFAQGSKNISFNTGQNATPTNRKKVENEIDKFIVDYFLNAKESSELEIIGTRSLQANSCLRKANTNKEYALDFKNSILPYFKDKKLSDLTPLVLKEWQNDMAKKVSNKRVNNMRVVLNGILQDAKTEGLIDKNPLESLPKLKTKRPSPNPFSLQEIQEIISKANEQDPYFADLCILAFFTGVRTGELIALTWDNIDFERNEITINKTIRKGLISTTKTKNSDRKIDMLPIVKQTLQRIQARNYNKTWVVCTSNTKERLTSPASLTKKWKKILSNLTISYRVFYQTRHSFASLMISKGENILWVSKMLGHASTATTLEKYSRYKDDGKEKAKWVQDIEI